MKKFKIISKVKIEGLNIKDEYVQEYNDDENVFGKMLLYHQRMKKIYPNCDFELIKAKRIE